MSPGTNMVAGPGVGGCGYTGWVYRVGIAGGYTGWVLPQPTLQPALLEESASPSAAGPGRPCRGLEWVGTSARTYRRRGRALYHPCGARSVPLGPPCTGPLECRLLANRARIDSFSRNLVKTAKCRQNMSKRPPIVPISKNGPRSHLLDF